MKAFKVLFEWLGWFWDKVIAACKWVLDGLILIIQFCVYLIFDGFCIVVEAFFSALDLSEAAFNYAGVWAGLPEQLIWIISKIGLPQGIALLGAAYTVRLTLNLIPGVFTRV